MTAKLTANVEVDGVWYRPGDTPPDDVAVRITNPKVWDGEPPRAASTTVDNEAVKEPPRRGPGSSAEAWRAYATHRGVQVPANASAQDIAALVDEHKSRQG